MCTRIEVMELYEAYYNMVYRLSFIMLKNEEDACDATQDVFLKLIKTDAGFESMEHAKAWLIVATRNHCRDIIKSSWKKMVSLTTEQTIFEHEKDNAKDDEQADMVLTSLLKLPQELRTLVYLHYFEGFTIEELAKQLKKNPSTLRSRLARARKLLKLDLSKEESP